MPTINQLVRKRRKNKTKKSKSPMLGVGLNSKDKKLTKYLISDRMFTFWVLNIKIYFRVSNRKDFIRW